MAEFPRPRVVVSSCLGLDACRFDGSSASSRFVELLQPHVDLVPVCPELSLGLGAPRPPVRLVQLDGQTRLVQPTTGCDLTDTMQDFARSFLESLPPVDGFLLKSRSPSCGLRDARLYRADRPSPLPQPRAGMFAEAVRARFPDLPAEDEARLTNRSIREHFLTAVFALADLRQALADGSRAGLATFHARYKLVLLAYDEQRLRSLGRLLGDAPRRLPQPVREAYAKDFRTALRRPPRRGGERLAPLLGALVRPSHRRGTFVLPTAGGGLPSPKTPLSVPVAVLRVWALRFSVSYLLGQRFLMPFPESLVCVEDSGRGDGWI
jgi:uncharacterized protein YbbK (DUF523 family)/uncharacterized protein YbgA (DUF1722 family)